MTRGRRIPADQVVLKRGDLIYDRDNREGVVDRVRDGRVWMSFTIEHGGGWNGARQSGFTVEAPTPPGPQPKWARDLQQLAERQVRLPEPPRRFRNQGLAGALLLWILVAAVTQNMVVVLALTALFCALPMARRS